MFTERQLFLAPFKSFYEHDFIAAMFAYCVKHFLPKGILYVLERGYHSTLRVNDVTAQFRAPFIGEDRCTVLTIDIYLVCCKRLVIE
jgi:hypothetical protein